MDSLTQIVLGAAVGEVALGRKIGNRALIWGAIGGTIPDMDIIANSFLSDIEALGFHRGISHSIFFSVFTPFLLGWLVNKLYDTGFYKTWFYKTLVAVLNAVLLFFIVFGLNYLFRQDDSPAWWFLVPSCGLGIYLIYRLYRFYFTKDLETVNTSFREWYWLFFLALSTHWLLDCFTAFGTQIFQPFSSYRVAFNNISVVDPFYTIPFLACMILVASSVRNTPKRILFKNLGLGISSFYMLLTLVNKWHVDQVFDQAYAHRNIQPIRSSAGPTILNNFLWSGVAEDKDNFYVGRYSVFDSDPNLHHLNIISKNDSLYTLWSSDKDYQTLRWFSNGYLTPFVTDSVIYLSDLRYGGLADTIDGPEDMIFNFKVIEENGKARFIETREPPADIGEMFRQLIERIKGY